MIINSTIEAGDTVVVLRGASLVPTQLIGKVCKVVRVSDDGAFFIVHDDDDKPGVNGYVSAKYLVSAVTPNAYHTLAEYKFTEDEQVKDVARDETVTVTAIDIGIDPKSDMLYPYQVMDVRGRKEWFREDMLMKINKTANVDTGYHPGRTKYDVDDLISFRLDETDIEQDTFDIASMNYHEGDLVYGRIMAIGLCDVGPQMYKVTCRFADGPDRTGWVYEKQIVSNDPMLFQSINHKALEVGSYVRYMGGAASDDWLNSHGVVPGTKGVVRQITPDSVPYLVQFLDESSSTSYIAVWLREDCVTTCSVDSDMAEKLLSTWRAIHEDDANDDIEEKGIPLDDDDVPVTPSIDAHYRGDVEPIELMQAQMTPEAFKGFLRGNIIKYAARMEKKGAEKLDVDKIVTYALWLQDVVYGHKVFVGGKDENKNGKE